ncbi:SAM-dependent chlorinase/fluorinase [bacterium]|nr:SAM-dependent chlorinase/fluorinase [bacterium]
MIITLLTDFGTDSPYPGIMKGVVLGICPAAHVVDITHDIAPQDIEAAAFVLKGAFRWFPTGSVHCAVVDPGVGSDRAVLIVRAGEHLFTAPDNGILKYIFAEFPDARVWRAGNQAYFLPDVSRTFHGRDIFAPVAAHLTNGVSPEKIGTETEDYIRGEIRRSVIKPDSIRGEIIWFDRFGNAVTNIHESALKAAAGVTVRIGNRVIQGLSQSYSDREPGELLAVIGSFGYLELAVRNGNIKQALGLAAGDKIEIRF